MNCSRVLYSVVPIRGEVCTQYTKIWLLNGPSNSDGSLHSKQYTLRNAPPLRACPSQRSLKG